MQTLRDLLTAFVVLSGSFQEVVRLQDRALTSETIRKRRLPQAWRQARDAYALISHHVPEGRIGFYELKIYTVDHRGNKVARLDTEVASEILRQLWEHVAWMKDCPRLSCNLPAIFGLQRTAEEIERLCKRLSQVIHAEESRTDL